MRLERYALRRRCHDPRRDCTSLGEDNNGWADVEGSSGVECADRGGGSIGCAAEAVSVALVRRALGVTPASEPLRDLVRDPQRVAGLRFTVGDVCLDLSRQPVTAETVDGLFQAADQAGVADRFARLWGGERVNVTEDRAVAHAALRAPASASMRVDGVDVVPLVHAERARCRALAERIRADTGITDIVNIGIGGSDLGPAMVTQALAAFGHERLRTHFVSNIDPADIASTLEGLRPESTVVVVVSKTFTTAETLANARVARRWIVDALGEDAVSRHFIAVSTAADRVGEFGISPSSTLGFWDWVGGRYSVWSSVGITPMIAVGPDAFDEFCAGGRIIDEYMVNTLIDGGGPNAVVLAAMIQVMHREVLGRSSRAVVPYCHDLRRFPAYLQQLDMESNGKSVDVHGATLTGPTGPVIWGEPGTNAQHAFFQLLHQGSDVIPVDFIAVAQPSRGDIDQHHMLMANMFAQASALVHGREAAGQPHRVMAGNRPSTVIMAEALTPSVLGQLIAIHEWLVFVQGAWWGVNSFDQFGVELGKEMAGSLATAVMGDAPLDPALDAATAASVAWYRTHRR